MKKLLNIMLITSVLLVGTNIVFADNEADTVKITAPVEKRLIKKQKKNNISGNKGEIKKLRNNQNAKLKTHEIAEKMYEDKFSTINSSVTYNDIPSEVTLDDCIKLALANHPAIMSAISNSDIYKTKVGQAWSNYFPKVTAGASYSRNDMFMTMGGNFANLMIQKYNMFYIPTLSANMLLFDFGKTKAIAESAKDIYESAKYDAQTSIENVIYNVKVAYYNMIFAKIQKEVYENTVADYELQLKQAKAYYDIGKKAKIDVTFAEYNLGKAKLNLIKAKNTQELANVELANAVGIPDLAKVMLLDGLNSKAYDVDFTKLIEIAESSRPSLLSAKKRMEAAELNVKSSKRAFTPNIDVFGSYNYGGRKINSDYGYQAGVQLQYSNVNLMLLKKQIDEANATYKKYIADYELEKQKVYLDVKSAYINLLNSHDSIGVAKLALKQAKEQQYQAKRRYEVGLGDAIEFKDSENTYLNAQLDYYATLLKYNVDVADVERVIGAPITQTNTEL